MITILIITIIGAIIGFYNAKKEYLPDAFDYAVNSLFGLIFGCFAGILISIILPMETYVETKTANIESLQDNSSIKGSFFLGSGNINGTMKYVFYIEENGYYSMMEVEHNKAKIKYVESEPRVIISRNRSTKSLINKFAIDVDCWDDSYIIEVPRNTIKNNYILDAQ